MIDKKTTDKINQLLNNGFAFGEHLTKRQRNEVERELIHWCDRNGLGAFLEEEMIYIIDSKYNKIMMIEITRNSIYFNPHEHMYLLEAVVITLEFITSKLTLPEEVKETTVDIEDDSTEEIPKPKPNFDIL